MKNFNRGFLSFIISAFMIIGIAGSSTATVFADGGQATEQQTDYIDSVNELIDNISATANNSNGWVSMDSGIANLALYKANQTTLSSYVDDIKNKLNDTTNPPSIYTYEKAVLGLLAAGKDPTHFDDGNSIVNLVEKIYNYDSEDMKNNAKYGISVYAFALMALDAANFYIPENATWTRQNLIDGILNDPSRQNDGGWYSWQYDNDSNPIKYVIDTDTTAQAISALSPYYNKNSSVKSAVDDAVNALSAAETDNGGFKSAYSQQENSNSTETVITGLCDNGIDPTTDSRFIKNNKNPMDALLSYAVSDKSGFGISDNETINGYATNQGLEALVSYKLLTEREGSVYKGFYVPATSITLNESEDKLVVGGSVQLKASMMPGDAKITWKSSNESAAAVDSTGKVTAAGEGNATITAEAEDNPDVKDTCEITVVKEIVHIENLTENTSFSLGNDADIKIKAENISSTDQPVTLLVALYDDNNKGKFINHVSVSQSIKRGDSSTIDASMQIPSTGKYTLKAFVLDDKDNPLSGTIEIPIK